MTWVFDDFQGAIVVKPMQDMYNLWDKVVKQFVQ